MILAEHFRVTTGSKRGSEASQAAVEHLSLVQLVFLQDKKINTNL